MRLPWAHSLRFRLLAATLVAMLAALVLAGLALAGLFREHVTREFGRGLVAQLDQITARLDFDATGQPVIDTTALSDPRWSRPYSGLYWQLDTVGAPSRRGVLRSRSLWDATLTPPVDALPDGSVHQHEISGPDGALLLVVERTMRPAEAPGVAWRLLVAADLRETEGAVARMRGALAASLAALLALLCAAALAQVGVGLAPLRRLQRALNAVHEGRSQRLQGPFPAELQPLVDDFNAVLHRNAEVVARARTGAGNLAHAIKTPLAALSQAADAAQRGSGGPTELASLVQEQVALTRRQVDWHLARSRAAAAQGLPGTHTAVAPVLAGLLRVVASAHADRPLQLTGGDVDPGLRFAGETQDLHEILGNVLDNAFKWAGQRVHISATGVADAGLCIVVEDDGPGIDAARRAAVMARGVRLDESVPGSGLGLAIVAELVDLYGGRVTLARATLGGLRVELQLPAAPSPARA
ncbi:MAG: sensor histidine kinase [Rubrivivax sp.]|nr:sensor histidine kinase [Rubrivivax sp.]